MTLNGVCGGLNVTSEPVDVEKVITSLIVFSFLLYIWGVRFVAPPSIPLSIGTTWWLACGLKKYQIEIKHKEGLPTKVL